MAVAEAMLAGCVPVVAPVGALPEVVGDAGVIIEDKDLATAISRGLPLAPAVAARERVLERFTLEQRATGLLASLEAARSRAKSP
jgi:glycosyltransferase involved in cell wall biosynthesis